MPADREVDERGEAGGDKAGHERLHASMLALGRRVSNATAFRDRRVAALAIAGLGLWAVFALAPLARPGIAPYTERLTTLGALVFLIAAPGYWLKLGHRSLLVSGLLVGGLYLSTFWIPTGGRLQDLFVLARVLAFFIFGLAGFNLVFVLEETIYDAHRMLPHRHRPFLVLPLLFAAAMAALLPWWAPRGGPVLPTFWIACLVTMGLLASWWIIRLVNDIDRRDLVIRELHLFVAGIMAAAVCADGVVYLTTAEAFISSLLAYVILLGTWLYVSYTTLQRTHLLIRGRNAAPWAAILLAGLYAIAAHGQGMYLATGTEAVQALTEERMAYMVFGIWIGVAFYAARAVWRTFRAVGQLRTITPRSRAAAERVARVAQGVLATERVVEEATRKVYLGIDRALPGAHPVPDQRLPRAGWELEGEKRVRLVKDGEE